MGKFTKQQKLKRQFNWEANRRRTAVNLLFPTRRCAGEAPVQRAVLLYVVVGESVAVLQLLSAEDEALLVSRLFH